MDDGQSTKDNGQNTMDNGLLNMNDGQWLMDNGQNTKDNGQWTIDFRLWSMDNLQKTIEARPDTRQPVADRWAGAEMRIFPLFNSIITDGRTNGRMDRRTKPLIELRVRN